MVHRRRQLCILGMQFQAAFYGYDEGVQSNDKVLAAIVWRRFFGFQCDDAEKIERLVKYIRVQVSLLCISKRKRENSYCHSSKKLNFIFQLDYLNNLTFEDIVFHQQVLTIPLKNVQIG